MKRWMPLALVTLVLFFAAGVAATYAQGTFKIPFKFQAGGKNCPAGEYILDQKGDGPVVLRQESTGKEVQVPVLSKLPQPQPPLEEPRLVFNMVGNFEPSYTEYVTEYVLAEVWLPGQEGCVTHVLKGAHKTQDVKGAAIKK